MFAAVVDAHTGRHTDMQQDNDKQTPMQRFRSALTWVNWQDLLILALAIAVPAILAYVRVQIGIYFGV